MCRMHTALAAVIATRHKPTDANQGQMMEQSDSTPSSCVSDMLDQGAWRMPLPLTGQHDIEDGKVTHCKPAVARLCSLEAEFHD